MSFTADCPSCGAPVTFRSAASMLAVCDYCRSTLVRHDTALENLGRMAELMADQSPLQRGSEGRWQGVHFGLVGRIQLRWGEGEAGSGVWNEWHLLFDDGRSGWLSEAGGEYVLSFPAPVPEGLPTFADLAVGQTLALPGGDFTVTNVLTAECVAGEGELPFVVGSGYPAPVVDLRDAAGRFATLDYSDLDSGGGRPLLFIGKPVALDALSLANLRNTDSIAAPKVEARIFRCPGCGATLTAHAAETQSIGCTQCGTVVDAGKAAGKALAQAARGLRIIPLLPLGATGTLRGVALTVIGFMQRSMESGGITYPWREYLLRAADGSTVWLTESDGHWNLARVQQKVPAARGTATPIRYEGEEYKHFAGYSARLDYVAGELPWRAKIGERVAVHDYVAPPRMLSREQSDGELSWTQAEYLDREELETAFRLATPLPPPRGVYANQPNLRMERHRPVCRHFWRFLLAAWIVHLALLALAPAPLLDHQLVWRTAGQIDVSGQGSVDDAPLPGDIALPQGARRLEVAHEAAITNNWIGLGLTLYNTGTGEAWNASREISYYEGVDGGERWSEGARSDELIFTDLPPGTYRLAEEAEFAPGSSAVPGRVTVRESGPRWSSLAVLLVFLALFPILTRWSAYRFEVARWAESDHPLVSDDDDDD